MHSFLFKIARAHLHNHIAPSICHCQAELRKRDVSSEEGFQERAVAHTEVKKWESPMGEWSFSFVELWDTLRKESPLRDGEGNGTSM